MMKSPIRPFITLGSLFAFGLFSPILALFLFLGRWEGEPEARVLTNPSDEIAADNKGAFAFGGPQSYLSVVSESRREGGASSLGSLLSQVDAHKAVSLVGWIKFRQKLEEGKRHHFIVHLVDSQRRGIALSFEKHGRGIRPAFFLGGIRNETRWYSFPEMPLSLHTWYAIALTFHGTGHVSLWYGWNSTPRRWHYQFLGAHQLNLSIIGSVQEPWLIGAPLSSGLRCLVKGFSVVSVNEKETTVSRALSELTAYLFSDSAGEIPFRFSSVLFSSDGKRGCHKCSSKLVRGRKIPSNGSQKS
jgi:hypothetical protein